MDDYFAGSRPAQAPPVPPPFGYAQPPYPQVGQPPPPPVWGQPYGGPPNAAMPIWGKLLIGLGIGFGVFVVLGILAAIAIPTVLSNGVASRTRVQIPSLAGGLPLRTDPASDQMVQPLRDLPIPGTHLAGAYGSGPAPEALVSVTRRRMTPAAQRGFLQGSMNAVRRASPDHAAEFGDIEPGSLGGRIMCSSGTTQTVCFFVDAGAYGSIIVFGTPERAVQLVPQLRASVEQRS